MTAFANRTPFTVHHLFIVDMNSTHAPTEKDILARVNDSLDSIRQSESKHNSQKHNITIMTITQGLIKCVCHDVHINQATHFNETINKQGSNKALFDAIGGSIATWRALSHLREHADSHQVSIFSDGKDESSKKYTACTLRTIITSLTGEGWKFTMIGTGALFPQVAKHIGIHNYYICRPPRTSKERNFLIAQLKRQWRLQQISNQLNSETQVAA